VSRAEALARDVLEQHGITAPPVPVEQLARENGAELSFEPIRGSVSGMLFRDDSRIVIGVNAAHPHTRQRFTIAHELGHLLLHESRTMIVDSHIFLRDESSSRGTDPEEREANAFAAELLMPALFLEREAHVLIDESPGLSATQLVLKLASTFDVSQQAMEIRLGNVGILSPLFVESG
jgi:Zn-dependent peptidase ImmA (M78 family)